MNAMLSTRSPLDTLEHLITTSGLSAERVRTLLAAVRETISQHEAEAQRNSRFRAVCEYAYEMIALLELDGTIAYVNPSFERELGHPLDQVTGRSGFDFIHPDDLATLLDMLGVALGQKQGYMMVPLRLRTARGEYRPYHVGGSFTFDDAGNPNGIATIYHEPPDLTIEKLRLEEGHLRAMLAKEQELSLLKTNMMMRISHEFRTPLSVIGTSSDLLHHFRERLSAEQIARHYHTIQSEIRRLSGVLDAIHFVVSAQAGSLYSEMLTFDLSELCRELTADAAIHEARTHILNLYMPDDPLPVVGDPALIKRAAMRLITNAVKFSPAGSVIDIALEHRDRELCIIVSDQGIGIPPADRERIFEPFFRGSNIDERPGIGLGLTIAYEIMRRHNGRVALHPPRLGGTSIALHLPTGDNSTF